jgi:cysteine desulfurase / selenocysteine lyase
MSRFNLTQIRADFPILHQSINGYPLVYLDNAATTQKPNAVINAVADYYRGYNANVHRAAHYLSDKATAAMEQARVQVSQFINSPKSEQIIWTRGTTEAINLVARSYAGHILRPGDQILVSMMEHHSNIVPWQLIAAEKGATVIPVPINTQGELDLQAFNTLLNERVKLVCMTQVSNALGTVNPIDQIIQASHAVGAKVLIDGAQAVAHLQVDVQALDCDFYVFSGHKLYAPTGIGVLWGKEALLDAMPPYQSGGEMIETVRFEGTEFNRLPYKFEAGTPHIAGAIGLGAAIDYLSQWDRQAVAEHEAGLLNYAIQQGQAMDLQRIGTAQNAIGVYSFLMPGTHPADVGTLLDQQGIAVRTGHHCTQPLMAHLGIPGTVRASFSMYNNFDDVQKFFTALIKTKQLLLG